MRLPQFAKDNAFMTISIAAALAAALAFSLEPLISAEMSARRLPPKTMLAILPPPGTQAQGIIDDTGSALSQIGLEMPFGPFLATLPVESAAISATPSSQLPYSLSLDVSLSPDDLKAKIASFVAKQSPSEIKTTLPDGSTMTEIVIDPKLVKISQLSIEGKNFWTVPQTNPQLTFSKNGQKATLFIGSSQLVDNHGIPELKSCSVSRNKNLSLGVGAGRFSLISATGNNILPYLRQYSCFQRFSTIN